jgi:hypothetical protein
VALLLLRTCKVGLLWPVAQEGVAVLVLWDVSLPEQLHAQQLGVEVNVLLQQSSTPSAVEQRT